MKKIALVLIILFCLSNLPVSFANDIKNFYTISMDSRQFSDADNNSGRNYLATFIVKHNSEELCKAIGDKPGALKACFEGGC